MWWSDCYERVVGRLVYNSYCNFLAATIAAPPIRRFYSFSRYIESGKDTNFLFLASPWLLDGVENLEEASQKYYGLDEHV